MPSFLLKAAFVYAATISIWKEQGHPTSSLCPKELTCSPHSSQTEHHSLHCSPGVSGSPFFLHFLLPTPAPGSGTVWRRWSLWLRELRQGPWDPAWCQWWVAWQGRHAIQGRMPQQDMGQWYSATGQARMVHCGQGVCGMAWCSAGEKGDHMMGGIPYSLHKGICGPPPHSNWTSLEIKSHCLPILAHQQATVSEKGKRNTQGVVPIAHLIVRHSCSITELFCCQGRSFLLKYRIRCSLSSNSWEKMAPQPHSKESFCSMNYFMKSGPCSTGALHRSLFIVPNASAYSADHHTFLGALPQSRFILVLWDKALTIPCQP